jgi:uncharacterized protein (DUF342 family)
MATIEAEETPKLQMLVGKPPGSTGDGSHYDRTELVIAQRDQEIARLATDAPSGGTIRLGARVRLAGDGVTVLADADGVVRFEDDKLWIEPVLHIPENVDFSTGHVEFDGDVLVGGNVMDLFKVSSTSGSVHVAGAIEAAEVIAAKDLVVRGGIAAKEKGACRAGADLSCKFASNASLTAGKDIHVEVEVNNSQVTAGGRIDSASCSILSSRVSAVGGICCRSLGSPTGNKTFAEAGVDHEFLERLKPALAQIQSLRAKAAQLRQQAAPLVRNQKTLSAQQKEQVTELLFEADAVDGDAKQRMALLQAAMEAARKRSNAVIEITGLLHPGVAVRFPGVEATTTAAVRGPLRIMPKLVRGTLCVAVVHSATGAVDLLDSVAHADDAPDVALRRASGKLI